LSTAIATEKKYIYSEKYFGSCKLATKEFPEHLLPNISECETTDAKATFKKIGH